MAVLGAVKTVTETKNSDTALVNDSDLTLTLAANTTYFIEGYLGLTETTSSTNHPARFRFATPSSPTRSLYVAYVVNDSGGLSTMNALGNTLQDEPVALSTITDLNGSSNGWRRILVHGLITTGGSGGTFALQWAQTSSSPDNTRLFGGSYLLLTSV